MKRDLDILIVWCNFNHNVKHIPIQKHLEYDAKFKIHEFDDEEEALKAIQENE